MKVQEFFSKHKNLPDLITTHPVFNDVKEVKKIFPSVGLENFSQPIDGSASFTTDAALDLIDDIIAVFNYTKNIGNFRMEVEQEIISKFQQAFDNLIKQLKSKRFINNYSKTKKLTLVAPASIGELQLKRGESLFKAYDKIKNYIYHNLGYKMQDYDKLDSFKDFSSATAPTDCRVTFSSAGTEGAWDIATMSMRGIQSCQAWNGQYARCLIGSIIDPNIGIIYIDTPEQTSYGSKMIRRCIVKFIVDYHTRKPVLYIDRMYPSYNAKIYEIFTKVLKEKTKGKFQILCYKEYSSYHKKYFIPSADCYQHLLRHSDAYNLNCDGYCNYSTIFSYRDTFFKIRVPNYPTAVANFNNVMESLSLNIAINTKPHTSNRYKDIIKNILVRQFSLSPNEDMFVANSKRVKYCINPEIVNKTISDEIKAALNENKHNINHLFLPYSDLTNVSVESYVAALSKQLREVFKNQLKQEFKKGK